MYIFQKIKFYIFLYLMLECVIMSHSSAIVLYISANIFSSLIFQPIFKSSGVFCLMLRCVSTSHSSAHLLYLVVVVENFPQLFFLLVSSPKQCPAHQEFFFFNPLFCICVHICCYVFVLSIR